MFYVEKLLLASKIERFSLLNMKNMVKREEHTIVGETEKCSCSVVLSWLHGPEVGTMTLARFEDLCLIQSDTHLDPRLACFLELAKWKHNLASPHSNLINEDILSTKKCPTLSVCKKYKSQTFNLDIGGDHAHAVVDHSLFSLDKLSETGFGLGLEEADTLDTKVLNRESRYFIVVENLEKDVSPSTIVSFVQELIGLKIEAYVFLSSSSEPFTRGALVVDCVEDLEKLCDFVVKPEQMIVSSKGRPWILTDPSATESVRPSFWCLEPDLENERELSAGDGLKVVELGSEEYSKAEKLRDLFLEFTNHQQKLAKRLALEEQKYLGCLI